MQKVAFGGGCHWCTEAVFQSLKGVDKVEQGWISSTYHDSCKPSEAVIVYHDSSLIPLDILIEIHLHTHRATSNHSMRTKYRSAVYTFTASQHKEVESILEEKKSLFDKPIVTKAYPFKSFELNQEKYLNYYQKNPKKPFCVTYIEPKLKMLLERFSMYAR